MALDNILDEFFGKEDAESNEEQPQEQAATPTAAEPVNEMPAAPAEPEIPAAPEMPAMPEEPVAPPQAMQPESPAQPEQPVAPEQPVNPYVYGAPQQPVNPPQQPVWQAPYGTPQQAAPYTAPYTAPTFPQPEAPVQMQAPGVTEKAPKKKRKAVIVIILIGVLCFAVAVAGMAIAGSHSSAKPDDSGSSIFDFNIDGDDSDDSTTDSDDAQASVVGSDEAAKTDKEGNLTAAGVAAEATDACVGITVYTEQSAYSYFYNYGQQNSDGGKTASGEGSGVIMSEANGKTYIMTCAHVIADGSSFTVTLDDDTEYEASLVGYDSQTDIGVLSINATGLSIAEFGDSDDIEVGEECVAIGCPGGLQFKNSVTKGIVSALDVPVSSSIGYSNECIQVDAAINPGNSGGALFNMQGQVIGINSSKIASTDYEGMGFAVPSNTAVETANALIKNGYVSGRAKLGIKYNTLENFTSAQSILSALNEKGFQNAAGTMVIQEVEEESDLYGKVQQYDMIIAVNGNTMTSVDVLTSVLAKSKPGDTVTLTIARIEGNQINTFDIDVKLIESKQ